MNFPWYQQEPDEITLQEANYILLDESAKEHFPNQYNNLLHSISQQVHDLKQQAEESNRLAFVQPSYEQALKLNAWIWGIDYIVDFDANRIGKTAGGVLNCALWLIPSNPDWQMFKFHTDHLNRTFKILQRPPIAALKLIRTHIQQHSLSFNPEKQFDDLENLASYNLIATHLNKIKQTIPPDPKKKTIWVGGPDSKFNEEIIMPEFVKWLPNEVISRFSSYDAKITLRFTDKRKKPNEINIIFKSYDSQDTKWSGAAVDGIMLSEGVPRDIFNEVRQRYKYPAFASWDYTPYEPRNTGTKTALAHSVFNDPTKLPLTPHIFSGFGIYTTPSYILSDDKRKDLIKSWGKDPQGDARIKGIFYSSSPVVLKNYDPKVHALQMSLDELRAKWAPRPLVLFRGIDPGWGHVTSCAWIALAPDNSRYIYRFYAKSQRSIEERCQDIISLSGNQRIKHPKNPNLWQEKIASKDTAIKITFIDYHTFKTDEVTKRPFAYNYIENGLLVRPSITFGPKERASIFDSNLKPQAYLPHPETTKPPGSKIYFLINEPGVAEAVQKMTSLFWLTFEKGEKRGLTKDTVQDYDDDELDAASYVVCPIFSYHSFFKKENTSGQQDESRISYSDVTFI